MSKLPDCGNCFFGGPGDPFECWDCWNGSHFVDICSYSFDGKKWTQTKEKETLDDLERETREDGSD